MLQAIRDATSEKLEKHLREADPAVRAGALATFEQMKAKLLEILTQKMALWDHIPWKRIGVFYCCVGGTIARSKEILAECIAEYDDAVAHGMLDRLHRVARRILDPGSRAGTELRQWLVSEQPLC